MKKNRMNDLNISDVRSNYAPIIIFAYNRADCLENLLHSLEHNDKTEDMELFILIDIPSLNDKRNIKRNVEVVNFVDDYKKRSKKFKKIQVIVAKEHKGLAKSIITGVSKVINRYGKAIVLEDDLIVSNDFLDYMQRGLNFYEDNEKVWAVAAHTLAMKELKYYKKDVFLNPRPESWGWGTWKDRWNRTDWDVKTYEHFKKDYVGQFLFNLGGNDLCRMLKMQMKDETFDSWAIRWGYQQFLERKYTVYPRESRVIHCGNDRRSTHGPAISTQPLREDYKRCTFENIKVDYILLLGFRRVNSESFNRMMRRIFRTQTAKGINLLKRL